MDLDLFTADSFGEAPLAAYLQESFSLSESSVETNTVLGWIEGVRIDCMAHRYPALAEPIQQDGIRMYSVEDIAAMKLNAIANRGSKKDFWDVYELMQHFSRAELLGFYQRKYPQSSLWSVEKSLSYFEDADVDPDPVCLKGRTWPQIKAAIQEWNRLS